MSHDNLMTAVTIYLNLKELQYRMVLKLAGMETTIDDREAAQQLSAFKDNRID
ncbi:hypothetical protein MHH52_01140 [Paenibacillus sp. FSL K6-0276]|uniref:hypothetical protein n=1 Tax=Paenibacillus sp. FSL K6-0276 TaxID=2921450 RepID=UPI0030EF05F3